jgi:hypothetical protein
MTTSLELAASLAFREWGRFAKWTICARCSARAYCRAKRSRGPFVCLGCFDQGITS